MRDHIRLDGSVNHIVNHEVDKIGEAKELAEKTIIMFGKDILECGEMHEYYDPETGVGINMPGFQSWNLLVLNMIEWI